MKRINEVLDEKQGSYVFPFLWMHGEEEQVLRTEIAKIYENGCHELCVEARPHPDFVGEGWWKDMDIVLDEVKKREMKIWILDDSHFPTGYANGAIKEKYPELKKRFLKLHQLDFCGPMKNAQVIIKYAFLDKEDKLEGVFLAKKESYTEIDPLTLTDISGGVSENKKVTFDLPEGEWRILIVVSTVKGGESQTEDYLNPIDPKATDVLLDEVYEKHYAKYADEFGKTIQGFFSDEPRFGNAHGPYAAIGAEDMVLPWRADLLELLNEEAKEDVKNYLPLLWVNGGEKAYVLRYHYMNLISRLYSENFSKRIGTWCEAHNVMYIGHTIEDNNAHARMGYGAGHFFRAMAGQHMAGVDVVLHQLMPGMDHGFNKAMTAKGWDGEFFHYVLAKLGSSLAHITPEMQGRCMCEVFGAYGWAEGTRMMKWIIDHMLVRGVNEFVPHAYSPKKYPDVDCPPHFFAEGNNPQNDEFGILMNYTNRLSHLLSGGLHKSNVALCYHGEAEWSGDYMLMQKPAAELMRNQIDFDIVPSDKVIEAECTDKQMIIAKQIYKVFVVPYSEALPARLIQKLADMTKQGLPVVFLKDLPKRSSEGAKVDNHLAILKQQASVIQTKELVTWMREHKFQEVVTTTKEPYLRYEQYEQEDGTLYFFVNEAPYQMIDTYISFPASGKLQKYDAFKNELQEVNAVQSDGQTTFKLKLLPYESAMYLITKDYPFSKVEKVTSQKETTIEGPFEIEAIRALEYPNACKKIRLDQLKSMQEVEGLKDFCGILRYQFDVDLKVEDKTSTYIQISGLMEAVRIYVNGVYVHTAICPPWEAEVSQYITDGKNHITLEVTTTLVRENYDWLSQFMLLEPTGITGEIKMIQKREG